MSFNNYPVVTPFGTVAICPQCKEMKTVIHYCDMCTKPRCMRCVEDHGDQCDECNVPIPDLVRAILERRRLIEEERTAALIKGTAGVF